MAQHSWQIISKAQSSTASSAHLMTKVASTASVLCASHQSVSVLVLLSEFMLCFNKLCLPVRCVCVCAFVCCFLLCSMAAHTTLQERQFVLLILFFSSTSPPHHHRLSVSTTIVSSTFFFFFRTICSSFFVVVVINAVVLSSPLSLQGFVFFLEYLAK